MNILHRIGMAVVYLILGIIFFIFITPIGFLLRLKRDAMARQWEPNTQSYFVVCKKIDVNNLEKMY